MPRRCVNGSLSVCMRMDASSAVSCGPWVTGFHSPGARNECHVVYWGCLSLELCVSFIYLAQQGTYSTNSTIRLWSEVLQLKIPTFVNFVNKVWWRRPMLHSRTQMLTETAAKSNHRFIYRSACRKETKLQVCWMPLPLWELIWKSMLLMTRWKVGSLRGLGLYGGQTQTHPPEASSGAMRRNVVTLDRLLVISSPRVRAHSTQIDQNMNWSRRRDGKIAISTH